MTQSGHRTVPYCTSFKQLPCLILTLGGGNETARQRRRQAAQTQRSKRRDVPKIALGRSSVATTKETNAQLRRERDEALEQLAATSEVLRAIARSPVEPKPAFEAMLANATRLCEASYGNMWLCEGTTCAPLRFTGRYRARTWNSWNNGGVELRSIPALNSLRCVQSKPDRPSKFRSSREPGLP